MAKVSLALEDTHPLVFWHSDPKTQSALEGSPARLATHSPWAKLKVERCALTIQGPYIGFWQSSYFAALAVAILYGEEQFASPGISAGKSQLEPLTETGNSAVL